MTYHTNGSLQLDHDRGDANRVSVEVRGPLDRQIATGRLVLKGPFCQHMRMLPASFVFERVADELWRTTVVDPAYWSPAAPASYRLQIEDATGRMVEQLLDVGLRRIEARGANLWMDGRRWVFRGTNDGPLPASVAGDWRETLLGAVVNPTDEEFIAEASYFGVPLIVRLASDDWESDLRRLIAYPAVQFALLPATWSGERTALTKVARNVLFIADLSMTPSFGVPRWAHAVMCSADRSQLEFANRLPSALPVLAHETVEGETSGQLERNALRIRSACEDLQRRLAPQFDLSGYLVSSIHRGSGNG